MSIKQTSFFFNSTVSETYKNKAEAFAKCLRYKLISFSGITDFAKYINDVKEKFDGIGTANNQIISAVLKNEDYEIAEQLFCSLRNDVSNEEGCLGKVYESMTENSSGSLCVNRWEYMGRNKNFNACGNNNGLFQSFIFNENSSSPGDLKSEKKDLSLPLLYGMENYEVSCTVPLASFSSSNLEKYFSDTDLCDERRPFIPCDLQTERLNKGTDNIFADITADWGKYNDRTNTAASLTQESVTLQTDDALNGTDEVHRVPSPMDLNTIKSVVSMENLEDDFQVKLRRCSSLKTWKNLPGTPSAKKIVRFADALGLDLADVRTFLDEIPKVPSSAYMDLECGPDYITVRPTNPTLVPKFQQPGNQMDFEDRVKSECVCLESATLMDNTVLAVSGCIRVRNLDYEKAVYVRYSSNNWQNYTDLQTTYVVNSSDSFSDKFSFILYGRALSIGQKLEFAVRFECRGNHFWDNNRGKNYVFECLAQSPSTSLFTEAPLIPTDAFSIFY